MGESKIDTDKVIGMMNEPPVIQARFAGSETVWNKGNQVLFDVRGMRLGQLPLNDYVAVRGEWESWLRQALAYAYLVRDQPVNMSTVRNVIQIDGDIDLGIAASPWGLLPGEQEAAGARIGDIIANGGTLTPEDWDTLVRYCHSPEFATGLFTNCTVEQLAVIAWLQTPTWSGDPIADLVYADHVSSLATTLATWAGIPGNSQQVADQITACLQSGLANPAGDGMSLIISVVPFDPTTTLLVANSMYDYSLAGGDTSRGPTTLITPDGTTMSDSLLAVLRMLANSPEAATDFFSNMDRVHNIDVTVSSDGTASPVDISLRIQWAIDRPWPDGGASAGAALAAASGSTTGPIATEGQSQVANQTLVAIAFEKQTNHDWTPQAGIGDAAAIIIAANPSDLFRASPYTKPGDPDSVIWPGVPMAGDDTIDGRLGLLLTATEFGAVIQAIASNPNDINAILVSYGAYMGTYWSYNVSDNPEAIVRLYFDAQSTQVNSAGRAACVLAFIIDNAVAGQDPQQAENSARDYAAITSVAATLWKAGEVAQSATEVPSPLALVFAVVGLFIDRVNQSEADAVARELAAAVANAKQTAITGWDTRKAVYTTFIQALVDAGYFTPDIIATLNAGNPDLHLTTPPDGLQPGCRFTLTNPDGTPTEEAAWLQDNLLSHPYDVITATSPGSVQDPRFTVELP